MDKVRLKSIIDYIIKYALTGSVRECVYRILRSLSSMNGIRSGI